MTQFSSPPSPILVTTVKVTAAQLKANMVTGVPIVPAQGPGKVIVPVAALSQMKFGTVAFNFATDLGIGDLLGNLTWVDYGAATFLNAGVNMLSYFNMPEYGGAGGKEVAQSHFDNIGLFLFGPNNATLGDGTLEINFFYAVVSMI